MDFLAAARALQPQIVEWRRAIHQNPELGFEEEETAALVASHLNALGLETQTGVGRTGVVARIEGSASGSGRRVGIRADMDALPLQEVNDVPYASQGPRQDARLRPRCPHRHAARRRHALRPEW